MAKVLSDGEALDAIHAVIRAYYDMPDDGSVTDGDIVADIADIVDSWRCHCHGFPAYFGCNHGDD